MAHFCSERKYRKFLDLIVNDAYNFGREICSVLVPNKNLSCFDFEPIMYENSTFLINTYKKHLLKELQD